MYLLLYIRALHYRLSSLGPTRNTRLTPPTPANLPTPCTAQAAENPFCISPPFPDYGRSSGRKFARDARGEDGKITVVPGVDDCASPEAQDGGNRMWRQRQGNTPELLKLAEGDRERAQDSVQYPAPGKHQQRLAAMERPQSVPQKAVHFLDDEPTAEDRVVPRSKSAHPRIAGPD